MLRILKMSINLNKNPCPIQDKIRGSMVGAVIGDCLGSPVECLYWEGIEVGFVLDKFAGYRESAGKKKPKVIEYTDDTAMARQIAYSLIKNKGMEPVDIAKRFYTEHGKEPWRGYGANVAQVFLGLSQTLSRDSDPFGPASRQFDGRGSYGNGAAMRVHPVGLFFENLDKVIENAKISAKITHAHPDGINGAILQATAVHCALNDMTNEETLKFLKNLAQNFESENYVEQLDDVISMLEEEEHDFAKGFELGNSVSALDSVPTALYSFLRARDPINGLETSNRFERTLQLAMTFGGDSDTICSMAGAIAGALYGESEIPEYMKQVCEGVEDARQQADDLTKIVSDSTSKPLAQLL